MWRTVLEIWQPIAKQPAEQEAVAHLAKALAGGATDAALLERFGDSCDWLLINRKLALQAAQRLRPLVRALCGSDPQAVLALLLRTGVAASVVQCSDDVVLVPDGVCQRCAALAEGFRSQADGWYLADAWPIPVHRQRVPLARADLLLVHGIISETGPLLHGQRVPDERLPVTLLRSLAAEGSVGWDLDLILQHGRRRPAAALGSLLQRSVDPVQALLPVLDRVAWCSRIDDLRQYNAWNGFVQHGHFMTQLFRPEQQSGTAVLLKTGWLAVVASALGADPGRIPLDDTCILACEQHLIAERRWPLGQARFRGAAYPAYRLSLDSLPALRWLADSEIQGGLIAADWQPA